MTELQENLRRGAREFNRGHYWHAHEGWERAWRRMDVPERHYVQGLIQACAVFHLLKLGRWSPARRLGRRAIERLAEARRGAVPRPEVPGLLKLLKRILAGLDASAPTHHAPAAGQVAEWLERAGRLRSRIRVKPRG
jgi:predicted metal-dependent hydrolase